MNIMTFCQLFIVTGLKTVKINNKVSKQILKAVAEVPKNGKENFILKWKKLVFFIQFQFFTIHHVF